MPRRPVEPATAVSSSSTSTARGPSHSAPYGQACLHCFKAKCRCVSRPDGDGCERCFRLQKTCHSSEAIRKRARPKTQSSADPSGGNDRVASLESKIDGIMTMLQSVTQAPASAQAAALRDVFGGRILVEEYQRWREEGDADEDGQRPLPPIPCRQNQNENRCRTQNQSQNQNQSLNTPSSLSSPDEVTDGPASVHETIPPNTSTTFLYESLSNDALENAWDIFRSTFLPYCPFLWFPPETTALHLKKHRPFLLRCIVAVTTTLVRDKASQAKAIKQVLAQQLLVDNKSNMDLLLGLLVYISWGTDPMVSRSGTQSRLVMLALSLVGDMRLNKPLPADQHMVTTYTSSNDKWDGKGYQREEQRSDDEPREARDDLLSKEEATLERQRAVLGCFLVTSATSIYFAQIDGMRWTPQMGDCLDAVEAHSEVPSDTVLAYQVRLQQIVQRAIHARENDAALPVYMTQAFHTQLEELRVKRPSFARDEDDELAQLWTTVLASHEHYVDLSLNEMTYSANTLAADGASTDATTSTDRITCYWRSVHAIRGLCESLLEGVPATAFAGFSFMVWAQLSRAIVTLVRLSTMPPLAASVEVSIDARSVRDTVDLLDVLDRFAERLKSAAAGLGRGLWLGPQRQIDDIFGRVAHLVKILREAAAARLATTEPDSRLDISMGVTAAGGDHPPWTVLESVLSQTTGGWGDLWLEGMFPRF